MFHRRPKAQRKTSRSPRRGFLFLGYLRELVLLCLFVGGLCVVIGLAAASASTRLSGTDDPMAHELDDSDAPAVVPVYRMGLSRDASKLMVFRSEGDVTLLDPRSGDELDCLKMYGKETAVAYLSRSGETLGLGAMDGTVTIWRGDAVIFEHLPVRGRDELVLDLAISPDDRLLVVAFASGRTFLWDLTQSDPQPQRLRALLRTNCLRFSPDSSKLVAAGEDGHVRVWDCAANRLLHDLPGHRTHVNAVSVSWDGRLLATAGGDGWVGVWEVETGRPLWKKHADVLQALTVGFSPDGKRLAVGGFDKQVGIWDVARGERIGVLYGHSAAVRSVEFSSDGRSLFTGSYDGTVRQWSLERPPRLLKTL